MSKERSLTDAEAAELAEHVASLAQARLPMGPGLRALADEMPRGRLARALGQLAASLDAGVPLAKAMESLGNRLPAYMRGLIAAGVRSERLPCVLTEVVELARIRRELRRQVVLSLAYPAVLMFLLFLLMLLFRLFMVAPFMSVFRDFGMALPAITVVFVKLSWVLILVVGLVVAALVIVPLAIRLLPGGRWLVPLAAKVPWLGPPLRWLGMVEMTRMLGLMVELEVPLGEALRLTAGSLRNASLARGCREAAATVALGMPLDESLRATRRFPATLLPFVGLQTHAALAGSLRSAADVYAQRARVQATILEVIAPPLVFLAIMGFLGLAILAFMMPLVSLITNLTK